MPCPYRKMTGKGGGHQWNEERFLDCAGRRVRRSERGGKSRPAPLGMTLVCVRGYGTAEAVPSRRTGSRKEQAEINASRRAPVPLRAPSNASHIPLAANPPDGPPVAPGVITASQTAPDQNP